MVSVQHWLGLGDWLIVSGAKPSPNPGFSSPPQSPLTRAQNQGPRAGRGLTTTVWVRSRHLGQVTVGPSFLFQARVPGHKQSHLVFLLSLSLMHLILTPPPLHLTYLLQTSCQQMKDTPGSAVGQYKYKVHHQAWTL